MNISVRHEAGRRFDPLAAQTEAAVAATRPPRPLAGDAVWDAGTCRPLASRTRPCCREAPDISPARDDGLTRPLCVNVPQPPPAPRSPVERSATPHGPLGLTLQSFPERSSRRVGQNLRDTDGWPTGYVRAPGHWQHHQVRNID